MRLFKWRQSHFTLLDQYTVTPMHDVRLCETADAKILIMVVGESPGDEETAAALGAGSAAGQLMPLKLIEVYVFDADRLRHVQNVHTNGATLYTPYLHARCMLIAMPDQRSGGLTKPEFLQWDSNFHMMADHQAVLFDDMVTNNYDLAFTQFQVNFQVFLHFPSQNNVLLVRQQYAGYDQRVYGRKLSPRTADRNKDGSEHANRYARLAGSIIFGPIA